MHALRSSEHRQLLTGRHGAAASSETPLEPHISQDYYYYYYYYYLFLLLLLLLLLLNLISEIQDR